MDTIANRLHKALSIRGLKQADLIRKTGINKGSMSCYLSGKYIPKQNTIFILAQALHVNEAWLMGADDVSMEPTRNRDSVVCIPVLGRVAAGIPIDAIEEIIDYEEVDERLSSIGDLFGLKIKGDSMVPNICDGDVVIVHKQPDAENGDTIIATINGDDAVCKRLLVYGNVTLLRSNNPAFDDIDVTGRTDFRIVGVVVELRRKFK